MRKEQNKPTQEPIKPDISNIDEEISLLSSIIEMLTAKIIKKTKKNENVVFFDTIEAKDKAPQEIRPEKKNQPSKKLHLNNKYEEV